MPWCALLTVVKNYSKSLENCNTFSSRPKPRPRPNAQDQDQDQDFMTQDEDQDQDFHFCPRGASRPKTRDQVPGIDDYIKLDKKKLKFF